MKVQNPATDDEIDEVKRTVTTLFSGLDTNTITKKAFLENKTWQDYMSTHCRCRQYVFQVSSFNSTS